MASPKEKNTKEEDESLNGERHHISRIWKEDSHHQNDHGEKLRPRIHLVDERVIWDVAANRQTSHVCTSWRLPLLSLPLS